jgi:cardiolipin synthase
MEKPARPLQCDLPPENAALFDYLPHITTLFAAGQFLILVFTLPWILTIKKESTSAMAWCLVVVLIPWLGFLLFLLFGYTHVHRPMRRKRRHRHRFRLSNPPPAREATRGLDAEPGKTWKNLGRLAVRLGGFPVSEGNEVSLYPDTPRFFDELFEAVRDARRHIHLEYFIVHGDETGKRLLELLTKQAGAGVEVRLLYDAIGSRKLRGRTLGPLRQAGGRCSAFLPLSLLRRRIQINMRNHRKLAAIDGRVGFIGGSNIGDEYLGKNPWFGYWRDASLRLEGPAVAGLQQIFVEDWDFACGETIQGEEYFPDLEPVGDDVVQIMESGPDQELNSIRELFFAAISSAEERLWIATPYFVPDGGILDALRLAGYSGVDVRVLCPFKPDHLLPFYAGRYYFADMLSAGVKIYQYTKGMIHSKLILVDGKWASLGSANLDWRSLHLNFEATCILHTPELIAELEQTFVNDLKDSILVERQAFAGRPFVSRLAENACRLVSPVL